MLENTTDPSVDTPEQGEMPSADVARALKRLIENGNEAAKPWLKQGAEIERYTTSSDYGFLYQEFDAELSFQARVNKAAEFTQIMGAFLYPHNPDASVHSSEGADKWARLRHALEEKYADYSAKQGDLARQARRCVDHALLWGRGVMWQGFDKKRNVVIDTFDRAENLIIDPDARTAEEQNWQARKRIKPRWELMQLYPQAKAIIERLPAYTKPESNKKSEDHGTDLVCYHHIWLGSSVSNYMPSLEAAQADQLSMSPKQKYVVADGKILHAGDWEIPYFLIDAWPGEYLDLVERPGCALPHPPMEPGLGHLRAMNYAYTLFLSKWRMMCRTPFAAVTINGQSIEPEQMFKVLQGEHLDILTVKVNGSDDNVDINKFFQRIDWGDPVPGFERMWAILSKEFEHSTGLTEVLYSGATPHQLRSAKAAELVESNSRTRSDSMRENVMLFMERLYRKRLFAARFLHDAADMASLFGPANGQLWGELGPPEMVEQEKQARGALVQQAVQIGMPPEQAEEMLGPPQFVSMESWINEAERTVDAGSMRRIDHEAQIQNLNVALNQLGPAVVNMPGGGEFVAALATEFAKLNRFSPELQDAARNIAVQMRQMQAMTGLPPTQSGPNPEQAPASGPMGGAPTTT